jgi:2-polyprenyl-3-methyl-5-hydroxy-6-metoxy-1,4-benzoquinol methylase
MSEPNALDAHGRAVKDDYNRRVRQWETIYEGATYHDHTIRERLRRVLALIDRHVVSGQALDVGCGAGQLVVELARRGFETAGIDLAEGMVEAARRRVADAGLHADLRMARVEQLPFEDGTFALVTALGVIEYLPDPLPALWELNRVLDAAGHVIVTAPNPIRLAFVADPLHTVWKRVGTAPRGYPRRYFSARRLTAALRAAGFEAVMVQGHGLGGFTLAGRPVLSEAGSIHTGLALEHRLPPRARTALGANLIAIARKPR